MCLYCIDMCVYVFVSIHGSQSQCHLPSLLFYFFSFLFLSFLLCVFKKEMRTTVTKEEEESNIGRSAWAHWSVRSSRPGYRQYSQKKEKLACYSVCAILCGPQNFFPRAQKKKEEKTKCNANTAKTSGVSRYT